MSILGLPPDALHKILEAVVPPRGKPRWKESVRALMRLLMSNSELWRAATHPRNSCIPRAVSSAAGYLTSAPSVRGGDVPPWKRVSLAASDTCHICHVITPAPVRWGFQARCCAWCLENATVPEQALDPNLARAMHGTRSDTRLVRSYRRGEPPAKKRHRVYLLADVVRTARAGPSP